MTARLLGRWADRSDEWHAARHLRIGASEIGTICGWNQFQTRDDLMQLKLGHTEPRPSTDATRRGVYCETAIAAWLADKEGITYDETKRGTWVDADQDWMLVNPDGITTDGRLVEFKAPEVRDLEHGWGRAGTDAIPLCYAAQVMWGMGILGLREALIGVLAGQPRFAFARYRVTFDPDAYAYLVIEATKFHTELLHQANQKDAA